MPARTRWGKCRDFDCNKGYGFITPNDNSGDIFVHYKDIKSDTSFKSLYPGQNVQYQVSYATGKRRAVNVKQVNNNNNNQNNNGNNNSNNNNINTQQNNNNNNHPSFQGNQNNQHQMNMNMNMNMSMNNNNNNNNVSVYYNNNNGINHQHPPQLQQQHNNYQNNQNISPPSHQSISHQSYQSPPSYQSPSYHQSPSQQHFMNNTINNNMNNNHNHNSNNNKKNNNNSKPSTNYNSNNERQRNQSSSDQDNKDNFDDDCKLETHFKWQWQDDFNQWQDFSTKDNKNMLSASKGQPIFYAIGQFRYEFTIDPYNFNRGIQRNTVTNRVRNCRKISTKFAVHQGLTLKKMLDSSWNDKYPSWWFDKSAEIHTADCVDWPLDNEICKEIEDIFNQTGQGYKIDSIFSIQNKFLWKHYQFLREIHSEALGKNNLNEKYLFHGTEHDAAQKITVQGFLRDHGRVMAFGRGTYFARSAAMSIGYSPQDNNGYHWMFLCAVILGESCPGSKSYQVPPSKPNSSVHYESMVDSVINPQIFVISKDYQAYPLFLIKFSPSSKGQNINTSQTNNLSTIVGLMNGLNVLQPVQLNNNNNNNYNGNNRKKNKKKKNKNSPSKSKNSKSLIPIKMSSDSGNKSMNNNNNNKKSISANNNNGNKNHKNSTNNNGNQALFSGTSTSTSSLLPTLNSIQVMSMPANGPGIIVPTMSTMPMTMPLILPMSLNNNLPQSLQSAPIPSSFGPNGLQPVNIPKPNKNFPPPAPPTTTTNRNVPTQQSNQGGSNGGPPMVPNGGFSSTNTSNVVSSPPVIPIIPNGPNPFRPMLRQNNNNNHNGNNHNNNLQYTPTTQPPNISVNNNNNNHNNNHNGGQTVMNVMNTMANKPKQQQQHHPHHQQQRGFKLSTGSNVTTSSNVPDPFRQQSPLLTATASSTPQSIPQPIPIVSMSPTPPNVSPFMQYNLNNPQNINDIYNS